MQITDRDRGVGPRNCGRAGAASPLHSAKNRFDTRRQILFSMPRQDMNTTFIKMQPTTSGSGVIALRHRGVLAIGGADSGS